MRLGGTPGLIPSPHPGLPSSLALLTGCWHINYKCPTWPEREDLRSHVTSSPELSVPTAGAGGARVTFSTLLKEGVERGNTAFSPWSVLLLEAINLQAYDL